MKDSERLENCTLFFRVMLSRRSNMATIMLIERDPLTQRLLVTRDMRLFVTRDLTFWLTFWHVWVWWYDFRKGCQSRSVTFKNWKTSYLLAGLWQLAEDNLSFTSSLRTYYFRVFWLIEKRNWAFDYWKKKSLEGTLSFWNWVLNNKQKCHVYCFIFKPPLYFICIKIILFCLCSQYLSSRSVTHDKSRA